MDAKLITEELRVRLPGWRDLLVGSQPEARQMLRSLIVDRLTMTPIRGGYRFGGTGTVEPLIGGLIPARTTHLEWRPHEDSRTRVSDLERAASYAARAIRHDRSGCGASYSLETFSLGFATQIDDLVGRTGGVCRARCVAEPSTCAACRPAPESKSSEAIHPRIFLPARSSCSEVSRTF